jgi:cell division septation protein DedD
MPIHPGDEDRVAAEMTRDLELLATAIAIQPPIGFVDRVMAAVAAEPLPQPARAFGVALLGGRFGAAFASVGDSWRVVVGGSTPLVVRAQALALVLVLAIGSLALASGAAVGAMGLFSGNPSPTPGPTNPVPSVEPSTPPPSMSPSMSPSPSASPESTPDASPEASPTS